MDCNYYSTIIRFWHIDFYQIKRCMYLQEFQALFGVVQVRLKLEFDNWFIFEKHYNTLFTKSFLHVYVYLKHFYILLCNHQMKCIQCAIFPYIIVDCKSCTGDIVGAVVGGTVFGSVITTIVFLCFFRAFRFLKIR